MELWEQGFNDWKKLLQDHEAEELLKDPMAVWDEAWRHVVMMTSEMVRTAGHEELSKDIQETLLS
jgi:hypothetical protein